MLSPDDLHAYQRRAVDFILNRQRVMLALDMGLGKTVSTLTALADLLDTVTVRRALVIAPLRVARTVWAQEAAQWSHTRHLTVEVCTGTEAQRIAALGRGADVCAINRECVPWLVKYYGKRWPFDAIVVDESSSFKSATAQRFKALRKVMPLTSHAVLLTGTPAPNGLLDLWAQMYLIDFGEALGRTMTAYRARWFDADYMRYRWTPRAGAADEIHAAIRDRMLVMRAADYLELPDRVDSAVRVELPPAVMRDYRRLERDMILELGTAQVQALSAGALISKALQYCNGAVYDDAGAWHEVHALKLDALQEILDDNPAEPVLVAYHYRSDLERLRKRFPDAVVLDKDARTIADWNAGRIRMLLAHPASAGHGLNLQRGGALVVWFGLTWSLELDQQFCARLHRQGQTRPVRVVRIVAAGCVDERVCRVLEAKAATQDALLAAVRDV